MLNNQSFSKNKQNNQKLVYSKDSAMNSTGEISIQGIFKSTSSLAQSIMKRSENKNIEDKFGGYTNENKNSKFYSSAFLIMNTNMSNRSHSSNNEINHNNNSLQDSSQLPIQSIKLGINPSKELRNLTHFYDKIQNDQQSYEKFANLRKEKRMDHLDAIDDYETWKNHYINIIEDRIKRKFESLKEDLEKTKSDLNSQFGVNNSELIPLTWNDINTIEMIYNQIITKRKDQISDSKNLIESLDQECELSVQNSINALKDNLINIGFNLDYQCHELAMEKSKWKENLFIKKKENNEIFFTEILTKEESLVSESKENLKNFILRWKNVKLNTYLQNLKDKLNSEEFVDNLERYDIIRTLQEDQKNIYEMRINLLQDKMFKLNSEDLSFKKMEMVMKQIEEIYNSAQTIYDNHTHKLVENSEKILKMTLEEIEKFKNQIRRIHYEFGEGKDNFNNKLYNNYEECTTIEDLIELEMSVIINQHKNERKDFISRIIAYLDDYDEYNHNNCVKLVNLFSQLGTRNDEHKKEIQDNERNYLLDIAKAADNDEDIVFDKEENLKRVIQEMKDSIDKFECDKSLQDAFKVMDELEVEYREFFTVIEALLNSHEGRLKNVFHTYESRILTVFGILDKGKIEDILNRRKLESDFLSRRKEGEIAQEELKALEEEMNNPKSKGNNLKKKVQPNTKLKKGEVAPNLVPIRKVDEFKSKLNYDYLIDYTIQELVQHNLRNIIYNREDDIFGLNVNIGNNENNINEGINNNNVINVENRNLESTGKTNKKKDEKNDKNINPTPAIIEDKSPETLIRFLNEFNIFQADTNKQFQSPISLKNTKLLNEENIFTETFLISTLENLFNQLCNRIVEDLKKIIENSKISENEQREEYLSELDIRLKSLAPRKGKVEVEEYDKRMNEVDIHKLKFEDHINNVTLRNEKDNEENINLLEDLQKSYEEFNQLYEKLYKGMEDEQTMKGLDDKHKKFKTIFYDLQAKITESEMRLLNFSKKSPENLINKNKNFILSLKTFKENGTYSLREIEYYKEKIENLNNENIIKQMDSRDKLNKEKINLIKSNMEMIQDKLEKRYNITIENIMAKDVIGKRFGVPKRLANEIVINMKMKCNQAQEGLERLFNNMKNEIGNFEEFKNNLNKNNIIEDNIFPLEVRKLLLTLNNCIFQYGKFIDAFKPNLNYNLTRVTLKEHTESSEIILKEEIEEDEKRKINELSNLGYLSKFIITFLENSTNSKDKKTEKDIPNFIIEINSLEEKIKIECQKVYTGEFAKIINNPQKLPPSLITFILEVKSDMEKFRLKCVRELRTFCQNLLEFSINIPNSIIEFIFINSIHFKQISYSKIMTEFNQIYEEVESLKKELSSKLGPYLANPYYLNTLNELEEKENLRRKNFSIEIDKIQFILIDNEEKAAGEFLKRFINNFEVLIILFDNFIYEEEFISLGDEEYFKERKDLNFLLKLKTENKSNLNLDSKRTFKKIYVGLDKNKLKINYYERFRNFANDYLQCKIYYLCFFI